MEIENLQNLWRRFKKDQDSEARSALINSYAYLIKLTAGRVVANLPPGLDREDLYTAGAMGLIKAVDVFDPERLTKFETYAVALIRGAILEFLREEDQVPRSVRERARTLESTFQFLESQIGTPPTEQQVAQHLGISLDELTQIMAETSRANVISLEEFLWEDDGIAEERARQMGKAIDLLPGRERLVISMYYYEGLTFTDIAKHLGVSEARAHQLHTQALMRVRAYLSGALAPEKPQVDQNTVDDVVAELLADVQSTEDFYDAEGTLAVSILPATRPEDVLRVSNPERRAKFERYLHLTLQNKNDVAALIESDSTNEETDRLHEGVQRGLKAEAEGRYRPAADVFADMEARYGLPAS